MHGVRRDRHPAQEAATVTGYEVKVEADHTPDPPQVFTQVRIHHIVSGVEVSPQALEDAIKRRKRNTARWRHGQGDR